MKRMKQIFALLLAMAMVLGMSMTTIAAPGSATITVNNAENATLTYIQAIKPDRTKPTGWGFASDAIAKAYTDAFGVSDPQVAIIMLAKATVLKDASGNPVPQTDAYDDLAIAEGVQAASSAQINKALSNVAVLGGLQGMAKPMTVSGADAAGIYVIKATESGWIYQTMSAYVGFGEAGDNYPQLQDAEVTAKKSSDTINKENLGDAADNAVAVGDIVEFEVTSNFPAVDPNAATKYYKIIDTLTGAEFVEDSVLIEVEGADSLPISARPAFSKSDDEKSQILTIDLSDLIDGGNTLAGAKVTITYSATVTEVSAHNEVVHQGTEIVNSDPAETDLYTGSITITKYAEDEQTPLSGAEFVVSRWVGNGFVADDDGDDFAIAEGKLEYATFDSSQKLTGWVSDINKANRIVTTDDGTASVHGLDAGVYGFIEVKAPEGYSINEGGATAELEFAGDVAEAIFTAKTEMVDTTLSALPSTGGIGTTIFTVGGCAIMILAAGLFFASRRKAMK